MVWYGMVCFGMTRVTLRNVFLIICIESTSSHLILPELAPVNLHLLTLFQLASAASCTQTTIRSTKSRSNRPPRRQRPSTWGTIPMPISSTTPQGNQYSRMPKKRLGGVWIEYPTSPVASDGCLFGCKCGVKKSIVIFFCLFLDHLSLSTSVRLFPAFGLDK